MEIALLFEKINTLYKITLLFPKKEPLRFKVREASLELLNDFVLASKFPNQENLIRKAEADFETLFAYFDLCAKQGWVDPNMLLAEKQSLGELKSALREKIFTEEPKSGFSSNQENGNEIPLTIEQNENQRIGLNERQEKIIKLLEGNQKIQVWQMKEEFPSVTKRTLRRDFEFLLKKNIIERIGESNSTFYKIR